MKCPKCGFEINEKDTICRGCGESVFNLKKAIENNAINNSTESTQIINNKSLPIDNEKITSNQDLNYNSASSTSELKKEETNKETIKETEELSSLKKDMKCSKCGASIQNNWNFCPNCHNKLNDNLVNNEEKYIPSKEEKKIFWIVIICILSPVISNILTILLSFFAYYLGEIITSLIYLFLTYLTPISYTIALILLSHGKNKYPKNKTIKLTFKIFITLLVLAVIFFAIAVPIMFVQLIEACKTMG